MTLASVIRRLKIVNTRLTSRPVSRASTPRLESLETIELLSKASLAALTRLPAAHVAPQGAIAPTTIGIESTVAATATQATALQTASVGPTLTNFGALVPPPSGPLTPVPFQPNIQLFNPSLGTLVDVRVTTTATINSSIVSQNISTTSPADISATLTNEKFQVNGLTSSSTPISDTLPDQAAGPVHVPAYSGEGAFQPPTTVNFGTLTGTKTDTFVLTQPSDLAFYTASTGRTTITPGLSASAVAGASAPNGNLQSQVVTTGSGVITVSYDYIPATPNVVKLVRYGIHHQPTVLQLNFSSAVNPAEATNPANYTVIVPNKAGSFTGPGVTTIPIASATLDSTGTNVTLVSSKRLNFHKLFQLQVKLPSNNGNTIVIEFGGKNSLAGFFFHGKYHISANGRITG